MSGPADGPGTTATSPRAPRPAHHGDAVGAADRRHGRPVSPAVYRRRRFVAVLGLLVVLALVVALLAFVWPGFARSDAAADPAPTVTVTAPEPTPTLDPVARTSDTAFAKVLPSTVLAFVLTGEEPVDAWTSAGAIEAYALTYADGEGPDATTVTVTAGQYASADEAAAAAAALVEAAGGADEEGEVTVGGDAAGAYSVSGDDDGTSTVTWYNGTAVLQATGPTGVVEDVYSAYPL
ncbi:hypothetical protein IF650_04835 [Cellulosimicrobium terreum]|nr:hypothetical protein [Cellulosimicrobium terreum]